MKKQCNGCRWWMWDCNDPDGFCSNKSKKACTREKRQLWEPMLDSGYCEKCGEQLEDKVCPHCTKPINKVLVWHDEERTSWTYCGRFEIVKFEKKYGLYRIYPDVLNDKNYNTVASFKTLETAKTIAAIIRINEIT